MFAKMNYPKHLIPNKHFNKILWHKELNNQYLIHYTDSTDFLDEDGKIKSNSIRTDHLRDFSASLLGKFTIEDIRIEIIGTNKGYFIDDWQVGSEVTIPLYIRDFKLNLLRGYFFFYISDIHNAELVEYDDPTKVKAKCVVLHTPVNCNFWHFSIRWFHNGVDLNTWTESHRRRILLSAKAFLIENAITKEPLFQELDSIHYFN